MKIISYNVNGIRAAVKKGFSDWLGVVLPDIICIQETKAEKSQVDTRFLEDLGYYHYWFSAQKKGYSGVAIFSKQQPKHIEYGTGIDYMDFEGRNLRLDFENISVMSMYLPSGTNLDRLEFKLKYMDDMMIYVETLKKKISNLVICGDYNICHEAIDIHDPIRNAKVSGFLPVERDWLSAFLSSGFIDTFRHLNKDSHNYSWWSYRANSRTNNKGWRIDYNMVSSNLRYKIKDAKILSKACHSDHCPITLDLEL